MNAASSAVATTLWLTGLPGAGKSTLANFVAGALGAKGVACHVLDGDVLRQGLCSDLGFSREDRTENVRRAAEICRSLNASGVVAIAALISPYRSDRELAQRIIGLQAFHEVWLSTPLAICEARDPKGLYRKARQGEILHFTGVSDPYEAPQRPALILDTDRLSLPECVDRLSRLLLEL